MSVIIEDALTVQNYLPWIENEEEVINFMRKIPLNKTDLRIPITMKYFLNNRDQISLLEQEIENDALDIISVLPICPFQDIIKHLRVLGNIHNRKEVAFRLLLNERNELDIQFDQTNCDLESRKRPLTITSTPNQNYTNSKVRKLDNLNVDVPGYFGVLEPSKVSDEKIVQPSSFPGNVTTNNLQMTDLVPAMAEQVPDIFQSLQAMPETRYESLLLPQGNDLTILPDSTAPLPNPSSDVTKNQVSRDSVQQMTRFTNNEGESFLSVDLSRIGSSIENLTNGNLIDEVQDDIPLARSSPKILPPNTTLSKVTEAKSAYFIKSEPPNENVLNSGLCDWFKNDSASQRPLRNIPPPNVTLPKNRNFDEKLVSRLIEIFPDTCSEYIREICDNKKWSDFDELVTTIIENEDHPKTQKPAYSKIVDPEEVFETVKALLPDADPIYLRMKCDMLGYNPEELNKFIDESSDKKNYPTKNQQLSVQNEQYTTEKFVELFPDPNNTLLDLEELFEIVKTLLPDADPTYLRMKCDTLGFNQEELNKFILESSDNKDYPTMKDYLRNQQLSAQTKQYTTEFCTEKFVELFPDPHNTFNDPSRTLGIDDYSRLYIKQYFQNKFSRLSLKIINKILKENKFKIIQSNNQLLLLDNSSLNQMKSKRKPGTLDSNIRNIPVLQEIAYLEHKVEIENFLKAKKQKDEEDREYAKHNGLMKTCQCCFDDEVMPEDIFYCPKDCLFCRSCIKKSCEILFGEGKTNFMCLTDCGEEFNLQTLKSILTPKMFSKIAQKKMIDEIKAAGIEDLEMCPFCDFANIPNEQDKIFKCLNPDCMKESCRNCKEPNHVPLHCDEIEKDENVKARVFIENKMTEALLCKCWKCGLSFFKEEGCNKMTCTCGAQMCYVCRKPVQDYTHFNGMGGDKYHLCPLYSDTNNLNKQKVLHAVNEAKAQIDPTKLIVDPANDLQEYYENRAQTSMQQGPPVALLNLAMGRNLFHARGRQRRHRQNHP